MPEPEALARGDIDRQFEAAGWVVHDRDESFHDADSLDGPEAIAAEIITGLQTGLEEMSLIYANLADITDRTEEVAK